MPTGAVATVLNLADVDPTAGSNLTVYPSGTPPTTSDLNPPTGGVASNLVVATLSGSGSFEVANRGSRAYRHRHRRGRVVHHALLSESDSRILIMVHG